jgi:hypothetical protein
MTKKAVKRPPKTSRRAAPKVPSKAAGADGISIAKSARPAREGPDNLRRRAQWFQRRTSGGTGNC